MKYYIDCEFDGLNGPLLSMALASETDKSMYVVMNYGTIRDPWVADNVIPHMFNVPQDRISGPLIFGAAQLDLPAAIEKFLIGDDWPHIIADWPDDLKYFNHYMITGPGTMIATAPAIKMSVKRVDAYPTALKGAIQHNAWWDAMALRTHFVGPEYD